MGGVCIDISYTLQCYLVAALLDWAAEGIDPEPIWDLLAQYTSGRFNRILKERDKVCNSFDLALW